MGFPEPLKLRVRQRAHFSCCLCHELGVEIHHIIPQSEGGDDTENNAAPLCPSCHTIYGANTERRKFIRETRDFWYDLCAKRYSSSERLDELAILINQTASKADLEVAVNKLESLISDLRQADDRAAYTPHFKELTNILEEIDTFRRTYSVAQQKRKVHLFLATGKLSKEARDKWHALLRRALDLQLLSPWVDEMVNHALSGELELRIAKEFEMSEAEFRSYLEHIVVKNLEHARAEPDAFMDDLTTADAELIQAQQAPEDLYKVWLSTAETERPHLMASWISEGLVQRLKFAVGRNAKGEAPGFFQLVKARELLVEGRNEEAFRALRTAFVLDPDITPTAFVMWLANPFIEEVGHVAANTEVREFVAEVFGPETLKFIFQARARHSGKANHSGDETTAQQGRVSRVRKNFLGVLRGILRPHSG